MTLISCLYEIWPKINEETHIETSEPVTLYAKSSPDPFSKLVDSITNLEGVKDWLNGVMYFNHQVLSDDLTGCTWSSKPIDETSGNESSEDIQFISHAKASLMLTKSMTYFEK